MAKENTFNLAFANNNNIIEIPELTEEISTSKGYVLYGSDDAYPEYLYSLYSTVTSLKTIIEGSSEYTAGDDAVCTIKGFENRINRQGMTMFELIRLLARDYLIYGGYAIQIIKNKLGEVVELYYLDFRFCRSSKDNQSIYYNEEFGKKWGRSNKTVIYPKFISEYNQPASVMYVKNNITGTYPSPRYSGALKACEIEKAIDNLHLNSLNNGMMSSYIINFNNGTPDQEQMKEIEKKLNNKFAGSENAGRIMVSFSPGKDNQTTVERLDITDFSEKYKAAAERSRENIFAAFRCNPQLVGHATANTGFSRQEYEEAYSLYDRTVIRPIQRTITDSIDKIFGMKGSVEITTFSFGEMNKETVS